MSRSSRVRTALLQGICLCLASAGCLSSSHAPLLNMAVSFGEPVHGFTLGTPVVRGEHDLLEGARYSPSGDRLLIDAGGRFESQPISLGTHFDELLLSWNVHVPAGAGALLEVSVAASGSAPWSPWLALGDWGSTLPAGARRTEFCAGEVQVDILQLEHAHQRARYRVSAHGGPIEVHSTTLCFTDSSRLDALWPGVAAGAIELDIPVRSQRRTAPGLASRICSPTSVAMVLAYAGREVATEEVAELLFDARHDIYGNWVRAVQGAFELGAPGVLVRLSSWSAVEHFLRAGIPLVISVKVRPGELDGAPYEQTRGHLLVLRGLDGAGGVLVNDPAAARPEDVARRYRMDQLEQVWMARGGVTYAIGAGKSARTD